MVPEFTNEQTSDFSQPANRQAMGEAIAQVRDEFGREWPLVIGGERVTTGEWIDSRDPCHWDRVGGRVAKAGRGQAEHAINAAWHAYAAWSSWAPAGRARLLMEAAARLRRDKHRFSATMVYEAGKTRPEADADTAEAIDFLEFYAREALRLSERQPLVPVRGEDNELVYQPLGVGVVIPPWNFPLAITVGMTSAAIVTGNTVVLKPASHTPIVAARFVELLEHAGLPPGVVQFLPGSGSEIGDFLVGHARTRFVSFTGSKEVGTHLYALAAQVQPGQRWLKRVVAEMGGKEAIIVDETADLDAAAEG